MKNIPKSRQSNLVVQESGNEILIYDLSINKAYCLNETSAIVWQLCNGKNSILKINRLMSEKLKTTVADDLIWLALDQLKKENLLENGHSFAFNYGDLNRRQVIKTVGLASMIALPLISSVIAPSAVVAQSNIGVCGCISATAPSGTFSFDPGCLCQVSSDCCNGQCVPLPNEVFIKTCNVDNPTPTLGAALCCRNG